MKIRSTLKKLRSLLKHPNVLKIALALLCFIGLYGALAIGLKAIGLENAQNYVKQAGVWSPIVFVLVCAMSLIIAPISASSLFVVGGTLFGKPICFLLSYLATLLGCSANFWISRKYGRRVAARFIGEKEMRQLDKFTRRLENQRGIAYIILVMPIAQDIVSYAVGLTSVSYWNFLVALVISSLVIVAAYIYLGTSLLEAIL